MITSKDKAAVFYSAFNRVGIQIPSEAGVLWWNLTEESKTGKLAAMTLEGLVQKYYPEVAISDITFHIEGTSNSTGFNFGGLGGDIQTVGVK